MIDESCALEGLDASRVMDHLTYCAYRYNRAECGMSAAALAKLFPDSGAAMEARFQEGWDASIPKATARL